jgi:hypothetical protein
MYQLKFLYQLAALGVLCAASTLSSQAASLVLVTSFDNASPTSPSPAGSTVGSPNTFSVTGGNVFYVGGVANDPGNPCFQAGASSATCLQMPTYQGITPELTSGIVFGAGNYSVEIEIAGGAKNAEVLAELDAPQMFTVLANSPFTTYHFVQAVPADVLAHLTISGNNEFLINSIKVAALTGASPVPEPSSWAMMLLAGAGLGGVGLFRRGGVSAMASAIRRRRQKK